MDNKLMYMAKRRNPKHVAALIYEGLCTFEFGITSEIFGLDRPEMGADWYEFVTFAETNDPVRAGGGLRVTAEAGLEALETAGTIIIPGWRTSDPAPSPELATALKNAHADGARLVSICSGAFLLAELGLLDGQPATTHWRYAEKFQTRYPSANVNPDVLYVDAGQVLTSAGSAAGIDLMLYIVQQDFGAEIANRIARRLVMPPHRAGGQKQFIETPMPKPRDAKLSALIDDIQAAPSKPWSLPDMARYAAMSQRTFSRKFQKLVGLSPGVWLLKTRVNAAKTLLETSQAGLADIAYATGLGSPENFIRQFKKHVGNSPSGYRRAFCANSATPQQ